MRNVLWIAALISTVLMVEFRPMDARLTGGKIIALEFAGTEGRARAMIESWGVSGLAGARAIQVRDSWWPWLYGVSLACACLLAGGPGAAQWAGASIVAVVFDLIENAGMNRMLAGDANQPWPALATLFASIKFLLILAALWHVLRRMWRKII